MAASEAAVEGISGAVGAMVACVATYPLLTVSTKQAVRRTAVPAEAGYGAPSRNRAGGGALAEMAEILRTEGWRGLYPGLQPALLGTAVSQGVYFSLYSLLRKAAVDRRRQAGLKGPTAEDIGISGALVVASLAGCGNVLLTNPFWVLVTRLQTESKQGHAKKGASESVRDIYAESGVMGFWRGVVPTLVMVTNPTVQYMLYEWLKARLAERKASQRKHAGSRARETASEIFVMSAIAKLGATLATYPMQLVKSRLQAADQGTGAGRPYSGTADALCKIWQHEGLPGFYSGMRTKIVQSILAAALLFMLKEKLTAGVKRALL